jgi:hypothetical protein
LHLLHAIRQSVFSSYLCRFFLFLDETFQGEVVGAESHINDSSGRLNGINGKVNGHQPHDTEVSFIL